MSVLSAAETKRLREKVRTAKKHFELGAAISLAFKSMSPSQRYRLHSHLPEVPRLDQWHWEEAWRKYEAVGSLANHWSMSVI